MAKASNNTYIILNLALVLSLALIIAVAESRAIIHAKSTEASVTVVCDSVTAVSSGDTCFDIAKSNNLTIAQFDSFNPNLNCNGLFVGQWLCIFGFTV